MNANRNRMVVAACVIFAIAMGFCTPIAHAQTPTRSPSPTPAQAPSRNPDLRLDPWFVALDRRLSPSDIPQGGELTRRFQALTPDHPAAYLELAELIVSESDQPAARDTARTLAVLAFAHADPSRAEATNTERAQEDPPSPAQAPAQAKAGGPAEAPADAPRDPAALARLRASACLLLASLSVSETDTAWLRGLARVVEPTLETRDWLRAEARIDTPDGAVDASQALGLVRAGRGNEAAKLLEQPEVRALIERYDRVLLGEGGGGDVLATLDRETRVWPCPECQNRRVVLQARSGGAGYARCGTCNANPGPTLSARELIGHLSLEARLLSGVQKSWAAQLAADLAAPLREPDPSELVETFGVATNFAWWRDGRWSNQP